jgi:hypothetical protein
VIAAAVDLVRGASQVSFSEFPYFIGGNGTLFTLRLPLFLPGSPIQSNCSEKSPLVVIKDIRLASANIWVYHRRALGAIPQKKFPDKPATAKRSQETTPDWLQGQIV